MQQQVPVLTEQAMRDAAFLAAHTTNQRLYCYSSNKIVAQNQAAMTEMYRKAFEAQTRLLSELALPIGSSLTAYGSKPPPAVVPLAPAPSEVPAPERSRKPDRDRTPPRPRRSRNRSRSPKTHRNPRSDFDLIEDVYEGLSADGTVDKGVFCRHLLAEMGRTRYAGGQVLRRYFADSCCTLQESISGRNATIERIPLAAPNVLTPSIRKTLRSIFDRFATDGVMLCSVLGNKARAELGDAFVKSETMKQYYNETSCPLMVETRYFGNGAQAGHVVLKSAPKQSVRSIVESLYAGLRCEGPVYRVDLEDAVEKALGTRCDSGKEALKNYFLDPHRDLIMVRCHNNRPVRVQRMDGSDAIKTPIEQHPEAPQPAQNSRVKLQAKDRWTDDGTEPRVPTDDELAKLLSAAGPTLATDIIRYDFLSEFEIMRKIVLHVLGRPAFADGAQKTRFMQVLATAGIGPKEHRLNLFDKCLRGSHAFLEVVPTGPKLAVGYKVRDDFCIVAASLGEIPLHSLPSNYLGEATRKLLDERGVMPSVESGDLRAYKMNDLLLDMKQTFAVIGAETREKLVENFFNKRGQGESLVRFKSADGEKWFTKKCS